MYRQFENTIIPCISTLSPRKTLLSSGWKELRQDKKEPFIVLCLSRNQAFSTMLIAKHNHSLKWRPLKASHFNCTFSRLFDLQTYVPPGPCGLVLPKAFSSYDRSFDVICLSTFPSLSLVPNMVYCRPYEFIFPSTMKDILLDSVLMVPSRGMPAWLRSLISDSKNQKCVACNIISHPQYSLRVAFFPEKTMLS